MICNKIRHAAAITSLLFPFALSFLSSEIANAGQIYISIGEARVKKSVLALPYIKILEESDGARKAARTLLETVNRDLDFTAVFKIQDQSAFIEPASAGLTLDAFKMSDWTTIGTEFLLKSGVSVANGNIAYEVRLYDVLGSKQILGKRYVATTSEATLLGHTVANELMQALTGRSGMFLSKLAFVCNKSGHKEIYAADYDGTNARAVTAHRTLSFAPAWAPDGKKIAYSVFTKNAKNIKNIDLYEMNLENNRSSLLSNRNGTNSGAAYSPDGSKVAMTMSFLGNQEIFLLDRVTKSVTKLTKSFGFDVDPAWSPDGKKIAFVSSRSNLPMIFTMNADGSGVQRLTFAGKFNATPSWSPDGKKIAFAGWNEGHFDVFTMNADGGGLERLTKNEGSNEDTTFSPDGNFVGFSSTRSGQKNIYAITLDGQTTRRLTHGLGNCEAPKWSPAVAP